MTCRSFKTMVPFSVLSSTQLKRQFSSYENIHDLWIYKDITVK